MNEKFSSGMKNPKQTKNQTNPFRLKPFQEIYKHLTNCFVLILVEERYLKFMLTLLSQYYALWILFTWFYLI